MAKCRKCGIEVDHPFQCSFCGDHFCVDCRLPENHNCPRGQLAARAREGEFFFVRERATASEEYSSGRASEKRSRRALGFFLILLLVVSATAYITYNYGYGKGFDIADQIGYNRGFRSGNDTGYSEGYVEGVKDGVGRGYIIRDPTYSEVTAFVGSDKTDKNQYSENYTCNHFTADFKNSAFNAGYRCGYVSITFIDSSHAIVCFNTTDKGLTFIEPQDDNVVTVTIEQQYFNRTFMNRQNLLTQC